MKAAQIRRQFLDYFVGRGHQEVPSSLLVPADDPTLLFTNAGMVQFKRVFQGVERRDYIRATTCQKCVRAGGKHNDLEQVGHTARHHTFFEMLGNFSFGDYFKREAIGYAWEWVTGKSWLGISPDRLRVSVHHADDEARKLWRDVAGVPDERIFGLSDKDNFWQMGDTGPAGPCSEIYVDLRDKKEWGQALTREQFEHLGESGALVEIWNLVFMQYDLQGDGSRNTLPRPSVDTGAGLERIAAVMQNVPSNFDTDLFIPILERAAEVIGRPYDRGAAGAPYRVLADHARAVTFLLADGVAPSSDGRGYVLRRILRRGVRYAWQAGRAEPTLALLVERVIETMGDVYPDLTSRKAEILRATRAEEERFLETIEGGMRRLDELTSAKTISGEDAFKLYDTYGFPLDLTQVIATERQQAVDVDGFEHALAQQRRRSRAARVSMTAAMTQAGKRGEWVDVRPEGRQRFIGYEQTASETDLLAFRQTGELVELVLQDNPFYAESGGQVSDTGVVQGDGWELTVEDVVKENGKSAVVGRFGDTFEPTPVRAHVNEARRRNIERNHTGTHLVHAALRKVLGTHVRQRGSLVAPERLRFDFSHHGPIADRTLANIEEEVNGRIWENLTVTTREMARDEAIAKGAMALFGEKYGERVRVVDIGDGVSLELCGGTHVPSTGQIALFRFTHETGAEAGVRRIEAITGPSAYRHGREIEERLGGAARLLKAPPEHVEKRIEALIEENRKQKRQIEDWLSKGSGSLEAASVTVIGDVELTLGDSDLEDRDQIALVMDAFRQGRSR
ncbi:MAG TPA: alanine--tRNA ligase, partial [Gemmatimonadales bacterium]|nr:alanine--tRNA ligase [Gemmatimonadales bacterium]